MDKELLISITIPSYRRNYRKSEAARATYYEKGRGKKLPLQFCDKALWKGQGIKEPNGTTYFWHGYPVQRKGAKRVIDYLATRDAKGDIERVVANQNYVGKPKVGNINGQYLWNGHIARFDRNKMIGEIKDQFRQHLMSMPKINRFPLIIEAELHDTVVDDIFSNGQDWDVGNRFLPYGKPFEDVLKKGTKDYPGCDIIPDDHRLYVTGAPYAIFCPIDNVDDRKIVFNIYVDRRPIILNNPIYQKTHGTQLG